MAAPVALWRKLWLLFTVIWVVVAALNAGTILAFADEAEVEKAIRPIVVGIAVPFLLFLVLFLYEKIISRGRPTPPPAK